MIDRIDYLLSDRDFATDFADLLRKYLGRRRTDVICGFPGLGKSSAAGKHIADLDSADFMGPNRWEDYEDCTKIRIVKPGRYVKDVIDVISKLKSENSNYDPSWFMIS